MTVREERRDTGGNESEGEVGRHAVATASTLM